MYRGLWNFIRKYTDGSHAVALFLPVMIIGWTVAGVLLGLVVNKDLLQRILCLKTGRGFFIG